MIAAALPLSQRLSSASTAPRSIRRPSACVPQALAQTRASAKFRRLQAIVTPEHYARVPRNPAFALSAVVSLKAVIFKSP